MKPVSYKGEDVQVKLANKIANLELQLANEQVAKQAIIKYAEELESKIESDEKESDEK